MTGSPLLVLYRAASACFAPIAPLFLRWRATIGLEAGAHIGERLGRASLKRPEGALALIHGATGGQIMDLLPLLERLGSAGFNSLVTTSAAGSSSIATLRLPPKCAHQFAPLDVRKFLARFLDHWRPNIVLLADSELPPNLIIETQRRSIPLALVNARLSARSFLFWRKAPGFFRALMRRVDLCLARTEADAGRFRSLGAQAVQAAGDAVYDLAPQPIDPAALARLLARIGARPAWMAAATSEGEEEIALEVHRRVARYFPDLLTIIAPRRGRRGFDLASHAEKLGLKARHSADDRENEAPPAVYIAATAAEAGLFYRAVGVVFLGKSLCGEGGENPILPAKLGCAILHGPDVGDFEEAYGALEAAGGAATVFDVESLANELALLLFDASEQRAMARVAADAMERLSGASNRIMLAIEPCIAQALVAQRGLDTDFPG